MNKHPTHATTAGRIYLALRKKAIAEKRTTDELLQLYALEAFVDRLSTSDRARDFTLKGGVLLSAYKVRRPTRDVDLASHSLPNAPAALQLVIAQIAALPREDGWTFATGQAETIREDDAYTGVRVPVHGSLASARQDFHVDISFGDPISPPPFPVSIDRLLGGQLSVLGYPLTMVFAEKVITALQRGATNTRWRDYADVFLLSRAHAVQGELLADSLGRVARARAVTMRALSEATQGYAELAQGRWTAWVRKQRLAERVPVEFGELLASVVAFADPILLGDCADRTWDPVATDWI
jgi:hypothetical protein